jgi:hypothetical protein
MPNPQESPEPMPSKTTPETRPGPSTGRPLTPAAQRALDEAEARRAAIDAHAGNIAGQREINGRGGLEPVRYDDWEVKGIASDF